MLDEIQDTTGHIAKRDGFAINFKEYYIREPSSDEIQMDWLLK